MQLEIAWRDEVNLEHELRSRTGSCVEVVLTENSSTIMTYKSAQGDTPSQLRVHRMFLSANSKVIQALSHWILDRRTRRAGRVLDDFIKKHEHLIRRQRTHSVKLRTRGIYHDLEAYYDDVNSDHFEGTVDAPITWGRMPRTRRRTSIRLGSYTPEDHLIRIHPLLDQDFVPGFFVRYVVFHEMLHAHLGIEKTASGRARIHTPQYNTLERAYPDYERATAWHDDPKNLGKLLRGAPRKSARPAA